MKYGIAHISIIPMRAEACDKAEMVNQLLFGEHYKIIEKRAKWLKIRLAHDHYEGWICHKQYFQIDKAQYLSLSEDIQTVIYSVGKEYQFENLRDWFQALYQVLLGQDQGPRFGSFVALYGLDESIKLIKRALAGEDLSA